MDTVSRLKIQALHSRNGSDRHYRLAGEAGGRPFVVNVEFSSATRQGEANALPPDLPLILQHAALLVLQNRTCDGALL